MRIACLVTEEEGESFRKHKFDASQRQVLGDIKSELKKIKLIQYREGQ
jgi:hypothetical protein